MFVFLSTVSLFLSSYLTSFSPSTNIGHTSIVEDGDVDDGGLQEDESARWERLSRSIFAPAGVEAYWRKNATKLRPVGRVLLWIRCERGVATQNIVNTSRHDLG